MSSFGLWPVVTSPGTLGGFEYFEIGEIFSPLGDLNVGEWLESNLLVRSDRNEVLNWLGDPKCFPGEAGDDHLMFGITYGD